jgi:hypothetical protein
MKFPSVVTIRAMDAANRLPVPRIAITLQLIPKRKNSYFVGPLITDEFGIVRFSRNVCEESIKAAQSMFLMDYTGNLEDCAPRLAVRLLPPENIAKMIKNYESSPGFWGLAFGDPVKLFTELPTVRNAEFEPARIDVTEDQILEHPNILFPLKSKTID